MRAESNTAVAAVVPILAEHFAQAVEASANRRDSHQQGVRRAARVIREAATPTAPARVPDVGLHRDPDRGGHDMTDLTPEALAVNSWCGLSLTCPWNNPCDVHRLIAALTEARAEVERWHAKCDEVGVPYDPDGFVRHHRNNAAMAAQVDTSTARFQRDAAEARLAAVRAIDPADHATSSRDYGRGFAEAIRLVREAMER